MMNADVDVDVDIDADAELSQQIIELRKLVKPEISDAVSDEG